MPRVTLLRTLPVLVALALGAGVAAFGPVVVAQDPPAAAPAQACPRCLAVRTGKFCSEDGSALVPAGFVGLHLAITKHATGKDAPAGIPDPLATLVRPDGTIDAERLKRLVADYVEATKHFRFGPGGPPSNPAPAEPALPDPAAGGPAPKAPAAAPLPVDPAAPVAVDLFAGRTATARKALSTRNGGSIKTEAAVEHGLQWLARHQADDGHWAAMAFASRCNGPACTGTGIADFDVGLTGLSVLALLGAGYSPLSHETVTDEVTGATVVLGDVARKGLQYFLDQQVSTGRFGPDAGEQMYNQAIATAAVCEAYGMTRATLYKEPAERAVLFIVSAQNYALGWRYTPKCGMNDTSVTTWCTLALRDARAVGLAVPGVSFEGALNWVKRVTDGNGQTGYDKLGSGEIFVPGKNEQWEHHPTMTAAGILCRIVAEGRGDSKLRRSASLLAADLPSWDPRSARPTNDFYYWYHGTNALFQLDGPGGGLWAKWNAALVTALADHQCGQDSGCRLGSWETEGVDRWAYAGGRVYGTAMNVLTLETYYRFPRSLEGK